MTWAGGRNPSFGPTNCALYRVAAHVQLSEGEGADAVAVAAGISAADLPRERRAHLLTGRAIGEKQGRAFEPKRSPRSSKRRKGCVWPRRW
ncbi:hypothetical protein [Streptomyces sp. NPDC058297]|uniref:hypothetical protein n=1 Tax=Streptomyces sp. NPDC058297 TaxID=3346433 RepID=UPI0036EBC423